MNISKKWALPVILLIFPSILYPAKKQDIINSAQKFLHRPTAAKVVTDIRDITPLSPPGTHGPPGSIVHLAPRGFLVLTKVNGRSQVVAYSLQHNWNADTGRNNILYHMLKNDLCNNDGAAAPGTQPDKSGLYSQNNENFYQWPETGTTESGGWIETKWGQTAPFNALCPLDPLTGRRCRTGCVSTAMAQLLNYFAYIGDVKLFNDQKYTTGTRGIRIDGDSTRCDFASFSTLNAALDSMRVKFENDRKLNGHEQAALSFVCGILTEMDYTSESSATHLRRYYDDFVEKFDYAGGEWYNSVHPSFYGILKQNIMNGFAALLSISYIPGPDQDGPREEEGHVVICDGYNTENFFHLNYGWKGVRDFWYRLPGHMYYYKTITGAVLNIKPFPASERLQLRPINPLELPAARLFQASQIKTATLTNPTGTPVHVDYILASPCFRVGRTADRLGAGIENLTIPPHATTRIMVQSVPETMGDFSGEIIIAYDNPRKYAVIPLNGYGDPVHGTVIRSHRVSGLWRRRDSPFYILNDIHIAYGDHLEIQPGCELLFGPDVLLTIGRDATLTAKGTIRDSIIFRPLENTRSWAGIKFDYSGYKDELAWCRIEGTDNFGIYIKSSTPAIRHIKIEKFTNWAVGFEGSNAKPEHLTIEGKTDSLSNRAFFFKQSAPVIKNCIVANTAGENALVRVKDLSSPVFINATITQNGTLGKKSGLISLGADCHVSFRNSILWDNPVLSNILATPAREGEPEAGLEFSHCNVDTLGGLGRDRENSYIQMVWGRGNMCRDPMINTGPDGDFTLAAGSPCIDAGDPNDPVENEPFPHGYLVNMGAFGGTPLAAHTTKNIPTVTPQPVDFGKVRESQHKEIKIYIKNGTSVVQQIDKITVTNPLHFSVLYLKLNDKRPVTGFTLEPGRMDSFKIKFINHPGTERIFKEKLIFETANGPDREIPLLAFAYTGTCIIGGDISGRLDKAQSPYNILENTTVAEGQTLVIEPGVTIKFEKNTHLRVGKNAVLKARGTPDSPIRFCALDSAAGWKGILFYNSADDDTMEYCIIQEGRTQLYTFTGQTVKGALALYWSDLFISHSRISNNNMNDNGVIYLYDAGLKMHRCVFDSNQNRQTGGPVMSVRSRLDVFQCRFLNNKGKDGGVFHLIDSDMDIKNCLLYDNTAVKGGVVKARGSKISFKNTTFTGNRSQSGGIIASALKNHVSLINSICWNNQALRGTLYFNESPVAGADTLILSYSNIDTNSSWFHKPGWKTGRDSLVREWCSGNISADPLFTHQNGKAFLLQEGSPCIDAGHPDISYQDIADPADVARALWPAKGGRRNDLGAYGGQSFCHVEFKPQNSESGNKHTTCFLLNNYPNPFNQSTNIEYRIIEPGHVTINIYNALGRDVATLYNGPQDMGYYRTVWNGTDRDGRRVGSGVYFYRIKTKNFHKCKKMLLIR